MWFIYTVLGVWAFFTSIKLINRYMPFSQPTLAVLPQADPWYEKMTPSAKRRFRTRFNDFINTTNFRFKEGVPQGQQNFIQTAIGLSAARLSMYLSKRSFDRYDKIIIYPESYYSILGRAYHKGEVNPGVGFIVFSYEAILQGMEKKEGINLLYHELAHALWLEHKLSEYDVFKDKLLDAFEIMATKELLHAGEEGHHFFRAYGYSNLAEFFAVATENFFERPNEFKKAVPELYGALAKVYKQDLVDQTL